MSAVLSIAGHRAVVALMAVDMASAVAMVVAAAP